MTRSDPPSAAVRRPARVFAFDGRIVRDGDHTVAVEQPVQITYGEVPFAVMMLSPADLVDFAYGFSLTEGVVTAAAEIRAVGVEEADGGLRLAVTLAGERMHRHLARQRALTGRTGCGVCGIDDIDALRRAEAARTSATRLSLEAIRRALDAMHERQALNQATRAVHAAAFADPTGAILEVREDVGRHNALDKLIGAMMRRGHPAGDGFVVITSRCSFEMIEKTAVYGAPSVVAISAPTSFAIARAKALGINLVAIARHDTVTVFHGEDHIVG